MPSHCSFSSIFLLVSIMSPSHRLLLWVSHCLETDSNEKLVLLMQNPQECNRGFVWDCGFSRPHIFYSFTIEIFYLCFLSACSDWALQLLQASQSSKMKYQTCSLAYRLGHWALSLFEHGGNSLPEAKVFVVIHFLKEEWSRVNSTKTKLSSSVSLNKWPALLFCPCFSVQLIECEWSAFMWGFKALGLH